MLKLPVYGSRPGPLQFSPDGALLACGGEWTGLRVYDLVAGRRLWGHLRRQTVPHGGRPVFTADGRAVARRGHPDEQFDARTGRPVTRPDGWPPGWNGTDRQSPCRRWTLLGGLSGVREPATGRGAFLGSVRVRPAGARAAVPLWRATPFAFRPDGEAVAAGYRDWLLVVRPADLLAVPQGVRTEVPAVARRLVGHHWQDATFTPDGRTLLAVSNEGLVRSWDTITWVERPPFDPGAGPLRGVAVSLDGLTAAAAGTKRVAVWDLD